MWDPSGEGRWTWSADEDVHLLLLAGGLLWELHVPHAAYLHRYAPNSPEPSEQPLDDATWQDTRILPDTPTSNDEGWQVLTRLAELPD